MRRLPPFAALRAFEAVSRTLSFTRAAEALGVTQAAVSRQVRALENDLGLQLIERRPGENELTREGETLSRAIRESMDTIRIAIEDITGSNRHDPLTVSVAPFFSTVRMTPKVMSFIKSNPDIDLRLHHAYTPPDYRREAVDMGINWGRGDWPGVVAEKLLDGSLCPMCTPEIARKLSADPERLFDHTLLYEFSFEDWRMWSVAAGFDMPADASGVRIDDTHALLQSALSGDGIALLFPSLLGNELASGRLVQPFPNSVDTGHHYYLNYPSYRPLPPAARRFRDWLVAQT